jgi:hypothetical protein
MLLDEQRRLIAPLFVHRPVTGRLTRLPRQLSPNIEDNTVFQLSANARQRFVRSGGNPKTLKPAQDYFFAKKYLSLSGLYATKL